MAGFSIDHRLIGAQGAIGRLQAATPLIQKRQLLALRRAALLAERELKKGIRTSAPGGQAFRPLSLSARTQRRGTKPLIDTGALLRSVTTVINEQGMQAFVGVHRRSGNVNVAVAHEFGTRPFVIPVTPGVRRFFYYLYFASGGAILPLSASKTEILHPGIPARPFIRPTIEKIRPQLQGVIVGTFVEGGGPI